MLFWLVVLVALYVVSLFGALLLTGGVKAVCRGILGVYALFWILLSALLLVLPMFLKAKSGMGPAVFWLALPVTGLLSVVSWNLWRAVGVKSSEVPEEQS